MDNSLAAFSSNPRYSPDGLEVEIEKEELELARKTDSEQTAIADLQPEAPKVETQEGFDMMGMHEKILGVVDNATRVPRDIVGGITKAIDNTMSFAIGRENVDAANQWLQEEMPDLVKITSAFEKGHAPSGTVSEVTQELSQFAVPFGAYMKGLKALSVAGGVEAGAFTTGFLSDVITSGTALDPHVDRLAAMAKEMGVDNKIVGWLADNENETDSEGRLKNILENAGLGLGMAAAITATVLPLKGMWRLSKAPKKPKSIEVEKVVEPKKEIEPQQKEAPSINMEDVTKLSEGDAKPVRLTPAERKYFSSIIENKADLSELVEASPSVKITKDGISISPDDLDGMMEYIEDTVTRREGRLPPGFMNDGFLKRITKDADVDKLDSIIKELKDL